MNRIMLKLISKYQTIPHQKRCRHFPTCSNYAKETYERFNFFYATFLTTKRIISCNPFSKPKYDPVPLKKEKSSSNQNG